ncbi:MAG: DUF1674 domain-containing protein [Gammaproteobacteria bacterium]|nr:DUF1674 domain-containing protein [Gammaproteobacteria bacterium]
MPNADNKTTIPRSGTPIAPTKSPPPEPLAPLPPEFGGPAGLEPTRYGDWERKGRCIDF